jgi:hypothetical protein
MIVERFPRTSKAPSDSRTMTMRPSVSWMTAWWFAGSILTVNRTMYVPVVSQQSSGSGPRSFSDRAAPPGTTHTSETTNPSAHRLNGILSIGITTFLLSSTVA